MKPVFGIGAAVTAALLIVVPARASPIETVLYRFHGGADGNEPVAGLISDAAGNLYTTTNFGGGSGCAPFGCGTIVRMSPPASGQSAWTETVLYRFPGNQNLAGPNPAFPDSNLLSDSAGNLYATTDWGSGYCWEAGCGAIVRLSPPAAGATSWTENTLYSFTGGADGFLPSDSLIKDASGNLFTSAMFGGFVHGSQCRGGRSAGGCGSIIELSPPASSSPNWTVNVLFDFEGNFKGQTDGFRPGSNLVADSAGNLYTLTYLGGGADCDGYGCGTLVKLTPPAAGSKKWTETILFRFDWTSPAGGLTTDAAGNFYTVTFTYKDSSCQGYACGAVVELTRPASPTGAWTETVLYTFKGGADGSSPGGRLIADKAGNLFLTTSDGGGSGCNKVGCGTIVKLSPPAAGATAWTETVLYRFQGGMDGATPEAALLPDRAGNLYATTAFGGGDGCANNFGCGTIIKLAHSGFVTKK